MVKEKNNYLLPIIATTLGFFMALLDTTIVNVSLPKITAYYEATFGEISWIIDSYNMAFGVILLTAVRLADQFGRKRIFQIGLLLFTVSSLLCGLSISVEMLIIFRAIQGLAAAMIVPVSIPMVLVHMPAEKIGSVTALFGIMAGVATSLGPTIGGFLSEKFAWQWVFYINIPIGALAIVLIQSSVRESFDSTASKKIDWGGMITLSGSLFALIYGLLQVKEAGWTSIPVLFCLISAAIGMLLFFMIEKKGKNPMLPVELFKNRQFTFGNIAALFLGIGMMSVYFLMAFYLTSVKEMSQLEAGLILSSSSVATMLITPIAAQAYKWGTKWFGVIGFMLFGIGTYLLGTIPLNSTIWITIGVLMVIGVGSGMIFSPLSMALIMQVPKEKAGIASGLFQVSRAIGSAIGVALLVVLLQHTMEDEIKLAKLEMMHQVEASELTRESKAHMIGEIKKMKKGDGQKAKQTTLEDALAQLGEKRNNLLQEAPIDEHSNIKWKFTKEQEAIKKLFPDLTQTMNRHVSSAFQFVFHLGSIALFIGVIFAYLNGINSREMVQYLRKRDTQIKLN